MRAMWICPFKRHFEAYHSTCTHAVYNPEKAKGAINHFKGNHVFSEAVQETLEMQSYMYRPISHRTVSDSFVYPRPPNSLLFYKIGVKL